MTATTERCPGCHGSGIEMSGVTYAGMSEYVGCHECGPECPDDCGCRASDATERPKSVAPRHLGATQSPDGSQGATEHVEITPDGNVQVMTTSWHEGSPYSCARPGCPAGCDRNDPTTEAPSDVRPVPPARDAELVEFEAVSAARYEAGLSAEGRAARHAALAWGAEFRTKPNPDQPDRCPSIDPHDTLQCTRRIHEDGQCQSGGIAWVKGTPRYMSDAERANRMEGMAERLAALLVDVEERLTGERDRARGTAATLEAENARLADKAALMGDVDRLEREVARLHELVGELRGAAAALKAENARLAEEATVSAALLETEIAKREAAEMRANRATADLDALESEDRRQDVQAKHWREVLRIRRELDGIRREMNDVTEIIAEALGYRPSGLPLDGWPHLSTTGDHTPTSLAAEAAGVLAKASRLREGIEALAAEMEADETPPDEERYVLDDYANALLELLAEGGE